MRNRKPPCQAQVSILVDAGKAMNEAGQAGSTGPETVAASATETAAVTVGSQGNNAAAYKPFDIRL